MSDVFGLSWDFKTAPDRLARLVEFSGDGNVAGWIHTRHVAAPEPIYFRTHLPDVEATCPDFPTNNQGWPIMSRRMLDVLLAVADFRHRAIPVVLLDEYDTVDEPTYQAPFHPKPGTYRDGYVAIQLLEHVDAIDWERSQFKPREEDPDGPWRVRKLALTEPASGFPPLFRLVGASSALWVSAEGRNALLAAQVHGPAFLAFGSVYASPVTVDPPPEIRKRRQGEQRQ